MISENSIAVILILEDENKTGSTKKLYRAFVKEHKNMAFI